jgi:uncharacterized tellurite resistance protein B-like protein
MFTYHLNEEEKDALLKLVGYLAASDQEVTDGERKFVLNLAHDLNVSSEGVFRGLDERSVDRLCARFERDSARRVALVELIEIARSDAEYFAEEKAAVRRVAEAMNISESEVEAIEDWVERGQQWHEQGRELLGLEGDQRISM